MSHADYRCDLCGTPRLQRAAGIPLETDHSLNVLFLVEDLELSGGSRDSNNVLLLLLFVFSGLGRSFVVVKIGQRGSRRWLLVVVVCRGRWWCRLPRAD